MASAVASDDDAVGERDGLTGVKDALVVDAPVIVEPMTGNGERLRRRTRQSCHTFFRSISSKVMTYSSVARLP